MATRLGKAIAIAALAHAEQEDKGGDAYILHPIKLMHRNRNRGESFMIVAICHDVREDSPVAYDWTWLTEEEDQALDNLTKRKGESYDDFITRCGSQRISCLVKIDDITHNLDGSRMPLQREITRADRDRWEKYRLALIRLYRIKEENGW